jgi:hypothetical protein
MKIIVNKRLQWIFSFYVYFFFPLRLDLIIWIRKGNCLQFECTSVHARFFQISWKWRLQKYGKVIKLLCMLRAILSAKTHIYHIIIYSWHKSLTKTYNGVSSDLNLLLLRIFFLPSPTRLDYMNKKGELLTIWVHLGSCSFFSDLSFAPLYLYVAACEIWWNPIIGFCEWLVSWIYKLLSLHGKKKSHCRHLGFKS